MQNDLLARHEGIRLDTSNWPILVLTPMDNISDQSIQDFMERYFAMVDAKKERYALIVEQITKDPGDLFELDPRLERRPNEKVILKRYASAFKGGRWASRASRASRWQEGNSLAPSQWSRSKQDHVSILVSRPQ